ncbi:sugar phosphate isomerase/epimerase family protein [Pragia fontium]|uniref:sugar phosphate isomerase/epimerase family protein n=1 Tax=Pragia fontium TaxID=82985 RepID=UPI000E0F67B0|nr:TIM barrel protein [Pragia fontium]
MMTRDEANKIIQRVDNLPLYLHAYAYHLNMRVENILPADLLDIAYEQKLTGVKIHVLDGETRALGQLDDAELALFRLKAEKLKLDIHIETSSSEQKYIDQAVRIAKQVKASSVRFYPRYEGPLKEVIAKIDADIQYIKNNYSQSGLTFTIEQHEDLKGIELVDIVKRSDMASLSILFDFANMINANEEPLDALDDMKDWVTQVHIKDALIIPEGNGKGHKACASGTGDMPFKQLLTKLICLGDEQPQVISYGLEEEVDYYAPAFRFTGEDDNPWIPWREMSETPLPTEKLAQRLAQEREDALKQIDFVRSTLQEIKRDALLTLEQENQI